MLPLKLSSLMLVWVVLQIHITIQNVNVISLMRFSGGLLAHDSNLVRVDRVGRIHNEKCLFICDEFSQMIFCVCFPDSHESSVKIFMERSWDFVNRFVWEPCNEVCNGYVIRLFLHRDTQSDTSSVSRSSYDPNVADFSSMASELPSARRSSTAEESDSGGGITLVSTKARRTDDNGGGVSLVSRKPLSGEQG